MSAPALPTPPFGAPIQPAPVYRKRLTARQEQVLTFIREFRGARGYAPTIREIGRHIGIRSTNGVSDHLRALERKGYITRDDITARGIVVVDERNLPPEPEPEPRRDPLLDEIDRLRGLLRRAHDALSQAYSSTVRTTLVLEELGAELDRTEERRG